MADHQKAQAWTFEAPGTPGTPGTPLSTLVASNALLSRSVRWGGAAACRQRSQLMLSASSNTSRYHKKSFNIPNELARYESPGDDGEIVGVKSVRAANITLKINPSLPWGDHYNITPFSEGTAQHLVAEEAALLYGNPSLSTVGGFFYTLYRKKEWVMSPKFCLKPHPQLHCCYMNPDDVRGCCFMNPDDNRSFGFMR